MINHSADGALFRVNPKTGVADRITTTGLAFILATTIVGGPGPLFDDIGLLA